VKRGSGSKALSLQFGASEDGTLTATVFRKSPRGRKFARVGRATLNVRAGTNKVTLSRKVTGKLRVASYRITLALADAAGNRSAARTLKFKLA
jgi:hypothetical protein